MRFYFDAWKPYDMQPMIICVQIVINGSYIQSHLFHPIENVHSWYLNVNKHNIVWSHFYFVLTNKSAQYFQRRNFDSFNANSICKDF